MIPQSKYADFLNVSKEEIKPEEAVTIVSEFNPPTNPAIKTFLMGLVNFKGEEKTLTINLNTYLELAEKISKDTKDWIGKRIVYKGLKKFTKGTGHFWTI